MDCHPTQVAHYDVLGNRVAHSEADELVTCLRDEAKVWIAGVASNDDETIKGATERGVEGEEVHAKLVAGGDVFEGHVTNYHDLSVFVAFVVYPRFLFIEDNEVTLPRTLFTTLALTAGLVSFHSTL